MPFPPILPLHSFFSSVIIRPVGLGWMDGDWREKLLLCARYNFDRNQTLIHGRKF